MEFYHYKLLLSYLFLTFDMDITYTKVIKIKSVQVFYFKLI